MKTFLTTFLLLALATSCHASPLLFLMQGGQGFTQGQINGITAISQAGPTTTGAQTGTLAAGDITASAACDAFSGGASAGLFLSVNGSVCAQLLCSDGGSNSGTLTCPIATPGTYTVQFSGSAEDSSGTFSAGSFVFPLP